MKKIIKATLLGLGALSVAACTDPAHLNGGAGGGMGADSAMGANDPHSVAYFNTTVGDRVLFEVDQSTLTETGRMTLMSQANWLMENAEYTAIIEGHADEQGTREYNLALGARRANAVQEFLVSRGVSSARLRTVSFGKERPIEICSEEACYAKNRRAVTVVAAGLGS